MLEELRKSFHEELDQIRKNLAKMMAFVIESIPRATDSLLQGNFEAAEAIIEDDDLLDAWSVELDTHCSQLLALQQPMAGDLRAVLTVYAVNNEIERCGDLACNVAKITTRSYGSTFSPEIRGFITKMSDEARLLMRLAMDSFVEEDGTLAISLHDLDDRLDELNRDFFGTILKANRQGALDFEIAMNLALVARYLERIGDHAVNIGEKVRYMIDGWTKEHIGAARARSKGLLEGELSNLAGDGETVLSGTSAAKTADS